MLLAFAAAKTGVCLCCQDKRLSLLPRQASVFAAKTGVCLCCQDWRLSLLPRLAPVFAPETGVCLCSQDWRLSLLPRLASVFAAKTGACLCSRDLRLSLLPRLASVFAPKAGVCICSRDGRLTNLLPHYELVWHSVMLITQYKDSGNSYIHHPLNSTTSRCQYHIRVRTPNPLSTPPTQSTSYSTKCHKPSVTRVVFSTVHKIKTFIKSTDHYQTCSYLCLTLRDCVG